MLFEVFTHQIALPVIAIGGVPVAGGFQRQRIDEYHGIAALRCINALCKQGIDVLIMVVKGLLQILGCTGNIAVLRQNDQINRAVKGIQLL